MIRGVGNIRLFRRIRSGIGYRYRHATIFQYFNQDMAQPEYPCIRLSGLHGVWFFLGQETESRLFVVVVYNLVTQTLNGQIFCHSEPGNGTVFLVQVPLDEKPEVGHAPETV